MNPAVITFRGLCMSAIHSLKNCCSVFALLMIILIGFVTTAKAENMRVCNTTPMKLSVAYGYEASNGNLRSGGWWKVSSGRCLDILLGTNPSHTYYYYAVTSSDDTTQNETWYWHGDSDKRRPTSKSFCMDRENAFEYDVPGLECGWAAWFRKASRTEKGFTVTLKASTLDRVALADVQYPDAPKPKVAPPADNSGDGLGAAAAILGGLILWGLIDNDLEQRDQEACMRSCSESRSRCVQLCTQ